jgi:MFS family permease
MTAESVEPVISHWVPYLLSSVYAGALADRFDCRRLIQIAQGLLMLASLAWGALFLTGLLAAGARAARPASPVG